MTKLEEFRDWLSSYLMECDDDDYPSAVWAVSDILEKFDLTFQEEISGVISSVE